MKKLLGILWSAYIILLPLNLTFWLGVENLLPVDFFAPLLLALSAWVWRREWPSLLRRDWPVLLYLALFLLSAGTAFLTGGLSRALIVAAAAQVYLAALYFGFRAECLERGRLTHWLGLWAVASSTYALVGIAGVALGYFGIATPLARWYPNLGSGAWRMVGTLGHSPNFIFSYLHAGLFVCLGLYLNARAGRPAPVSRGWLAVLTALHTAALFLTYSRGVLGTAAGVLLVYSLRSGSLTRPLRVLLGTAWAGLAAAFLYSAVFFTYTTDALFTPSQAAADSLRLAVDAPHKSLYAYKNVVHLSDGAHYTRLPGGFTFLPAQHWYLLTASWEMFRAHPLLGVGPGLYPKRLDCLRDSGALGIPQGMPELKPHSTFLGALAEGGFIGFAALVLLWVFLLRRRLGGSDPLALALWCGLAGWLVVGLNIDILNFRWLWLYFALTMAALRTGESEGG
ncbi:O-antigen ligase family protein [bacterium]|nr:O-antigen ligase family protein [bacterium]